MNKNRFMGTPGLGHPMILVDSRKAEARTTAGPSLCLKDGCVQDDSSLFHGGVQAVARVSVMRSRIFLSTSSALMKKGVLRQWMLSWPESGE